MHRAVRIARHVRRVRPRAAVRCASSLSGAVGTWPRGAWGLGTLALAAAGAAAAVEAAADSREEWAAEPEPREERAADPMSRCAVVAASSAVEEGVATGADDDDGPPLQLMLFSGNSNVALSREIAAHLGVSLSEADIRTFADGEVSVQIMDPVRGGDVFIVQSTCPPVNHNIMELLLMIRWASVRAPERVGSSAARC